jgi:hypothetical protein
MKAFAFGLLILAVGCAGPPYTADNNVGFVKEALFDDASRVLAEQGIRVERGQAVGDLTGVRVAFGDVWWATQILVQWRRGKEPGSYVTREEFELQLENP